MLDLPSLPRLQQAAMFSCQLLELLLNASVLLHAAVDGQPLRQAGSVDKRAMQPQA